jgi:hypothetical protein
MSRRKQAYQEGRAASSKRQRANNAFASSILSSGHTTGTTSLGDYSAASSTSARWIAPRFTVSVALPALPVVSRPPVGARWDFDETSRPINDHSGVKYVVTDARDNLVSSCSLPIFQCALFLTFRLVGPSS